MHKMALQFVIGVFVILSIQGVVQADDIALPDEVHIVPPTPDIPHTVAAFGGAWIGGAWDGVLPHALIQSYIDTDQLLLAGISRGGYLSVVYAGNGKYRGRLKGVINFVGGWMGDGCGTDLNSPGYTDAAPHISFPTLWLYATGDAYYSPQAIQGYVRAYTAAGGRAQVTLYDTVPGNGHRLPMFVSLWKPAVDQYLAAIGFARQ
jgi:hypothetical protein